MKQNGTFSQSSTYLVGGRQQNLETSDPFRWSAKISSASSKVDNRGVFFVSGNVAARTAAINAATPKIVCKQIMDF